MDKRKTVDLDYRLEVVQGHTFGTSRQAVSINFRSVVNRFRDIIVRQEPLLQYPTPISSKIWDVAFGANL